MNSLMLLIRKVLSALTLVFAVKAKTLWVIIQIIICIYAYVGEFTWLQSTINLFIGLFLVLFFYLSYICELLQEKGNE